MPAAKNWDKKVWEELSKIDVTEYAKRKGTTGFNPLYIPWAVVHHILMSKYAGNYTRTDHPLEILPDGTGLVRVTINIRGGEQTAILSVMNHKFAPVVCDSRVVQDAYQRAYVKAAGLHGLGLQLWITGEGEPVSLDPTPSKNSYNNRSKGGKLYLESKKELSALIKQVEADSTATIDADVLDSAKSLLTDKAKPTNRIVKATQFIQSQL